MRQDTAKQAQRKDKTTAKEIAEAFSTITGQKICEEEVSLIQNIQLPEDENLTSPKMLKLWKGTPTVND